ncbi:MAG: flagellar assembly peptidoglycan hydrolase FlgJ [Thermomonas hydrothermalis]|uniref:flagellar assembly peptidoglycan hydrolase FlgJ n=1 Tax=Thermomonas hydrothermalis TaxID=213588 RepID=UPI0023523152|nr:flagellar assembly peptidoglycan hydrolase FlgJ [Thermomonas hydrothermalis]MCL6618479.1 flagellar assembly peptidoglycan hydrolase FlgJ [Thermomonas hydrothermalis]
MRLPSATPIPLERPQTPERARVEEAARGLEGQFAQMLIKTLRSTTPGDPFAGDPTYRDLYDQALAQSLTKGRGLGLQPMIVKQLTRATQGDAQPATPAGPLPINPPARPIPLQPAGTPSGLPLPAGLRGDVLALTPASHGTSLPAMARPPMLPQQTASTATCDENAPLDCSSPEAFVRSVWPHAKKAAAELGVSPKALVAQAALETGWGRRLAGKDGKASSHNLFGIKASGGWQGAQVDAPTFEYVNGERISVRARFRSYASAADAFADYTRLLQNPRYAAARGSGDDVHRFAHALQRAGYATDPMYAAKIAAIADGATLRRALDGLEG